MPSTKHPSDEPGGPESTAVRVVLSRASERLETRAINALQRFRASGLSAAGAPRRFGRYEIERVLGRGGNGVVLGARDTRLGRDVALKFQRPNRRIDAAGLGRRYGLLAEGRALAAVDDPAVSPVFDIEAYDCDLDPGLREVVERYELPRRGRYIVLEWIHGRTLESAWSSAIPLSDRIGHVRGLADALTALHDAGLVHRDVKPANAMVEDSGRVRLLDLGIARMRAALIDSDPDPSGDSVGDSVGDPGETDPVVPAAYAVGTPHYMAPEQAVGLPADARADQYSLAACLYRAVFDAPPPRMPGCGSSGIWRIEIPTTLPSGEPTPRRLRKALERGLALEPEDRFGSVHALGRAIRFDPRRVRRSRWIAAAGALVVLVLLAGVWLLRAPRPALVEARASVPVEVAIPFGRASELSDAWRELERARTLRRRGRVASALARVEAIAARARMWGAKPLLAESVLELAKIHELLGHVDELRETYRRAFEAGQRAGSGWVTAVAATRLARWNATFDGDLARAQQWLGYGRAASTSIGAGRDAWAMLAMGEATLHYLAGEHAVAVATLEAELSGEPPSGVHGREIEARLHVMSANFALFTGDLERAAVHSRSATASLARLIDGPPSLQIQGLLTAAVLDDRHGRIEAALAKYERAERVARVLPPEHPVRVHVTINWAASVMQAGRVEEGLSMCRDAIARADSRRIEERLAAQLHECVGVTSMRLGRARQAVEHLERARVAYGIVVGGTGPERVRVLVNLSAALAVLGERERAEASFRRALAEIELVHGSHHYIMGDVACDYALFSATQGGDVLRARRFWYRCIEILEPLRGAEHWRVVRAHAALAEPAAVPPQLQPP